jgi:hypothetical protein
MPLIRYASHDKIAAQFGVSRARVYAWEKSGAPTTGEKYLAQWLLTRSDLKPCVRAEAERIMGIVRPQQRVALVDSDEFAAVADDIEGALKQATRGVKLTGKADSIAASNARLASFTDYYAERLALATQNEDHAEIKFWGDEYRRSEKIQQDGQMLAKKLGIESGELIKREECEAYARAVAYWLVRCVDAARRRMREKLVGMATPQEADAVIDGELLEAVLLRPMARGLKVDGKLALPKWLHAAVVDAVDDYIEQGAEQAEAEAQTGEVAP